MFQLIYGCVRSIEIVKSHIGSISLVRCQELFLGSWFCTKTVVISIHATDLVRCREVVLLLEGPLWEVRLDSSCKQRRKGVQHGRLAPLELYVGALGI